MSTPRNALYHQRRAKRIAAEDARRELREQMAATAVSFQSFHRQVTDQLLQAIAAEDAALLGQHKPH